MKPNEYESGVLVIIFSLGGLYGFTDYGAPQTTGTFIGSGLAVLVIALLVGWLLSFILRIFVSNEKRMKLKVRLPIINALVLSIFLFALGVLEHNPFF